MILNCLLLVLLLAVCISVLATTSEHFFVPSLSSISELMRLSPAVAGVTLVAFGNGAPDVFTSYAALVT